MTLTMNLKEMHIYISFYVLYSFRCRVESKFPCGGRGLRYASLISCSDFFFSWFRPSSPLGSLFKLIWCLDHKRRTTALISFFPVFDLYATPHSSNLFDILIEMPNWHTRYARLCNGYNFNRCTQNIPKICPLPNICRLYMPEINIRYAQGMS